MHHDPPSAAPTAPQPKMLITGGYCPEFWRWRVARVTAKAIVLATGSRMQRLSPDQWLPFLAARCQLDPVYIDGSPIVPPAAVPLWLPGELPPTQPPPPPVRPTGVVRSLDLGSLVRLARDLLGSAQFKQLPTRKGQTHVRIQAGGNQPGRNQPGRNQPEYSVFYDVRAGTGPGCSCGGGRFAAQGECPHILAALMHDPKASALLLQILTAVPLRRWHPD